MDNKYQVRFKNINKKVLKKFKQLNEKNVYGVFQAQQIVSKLQRLIPGIEKITIVITDLETRQQLEFEDLYIDPNSSSIQLLDILQKQLIEAGDQIDGTKIYTELNRQYNNEMKFSPSETVMPKKSVLSMLISFLNKEPKFIDGVPPYNQPFLQVAESESKTLDEKEIAADEQPMIFEYEMIFRLKDGGFVESNFQSDKKHLERNEALKLYFPFQGKYIQVGDERIEISTIQGIKLNKLDYSTLFQLPEDFEFSDLVSLPE